VSTKPLTTWQKTIKLHFAFHSETKKTSAGSGAEVFKKLTSGLPGFSWINRTAFWSLVFIGIIIFLSIRFKIKKIEVD
jgi:hypothetical protein